MAKLSKVARAFEQSTSALAAERIAAAAAVATALSVATPSHVIAAKAPAAAVVYVPFTEAENAIFDACLAIEKHEHSAAEKRVKMIAAIGAQLRAALGDTPTYEAWQYMRKAIALRSVDAGYAADTMRKHLEAAMVANYGSFPKSQNAAAQRKAKQRAAAKAKAPAIKAADVKAAAAEGFNAGREHALASDDIESIIARVGMVAILAACNRILAAEDATADAADAVQVALEAIAA